MKAKKEGWRFDKGEIGLFVNKMIRLFHRKFQRILPKLKHKTPIFHVSLSYIYILHTSMHTYTYYTHTCIYE